MNKKILLQFLLLSIAIIFSLSIYKVYFEKDKKKLSDLSKNKNKSLIQNKDTNIIKNLAIFSDSIIYTNLQNKIKADRLEIDLITKNSKIFMNDESKKIKALVIN